MKTSSYGVGSKRLLSSRNQQFNKSFFEIIMARTYTTVLAHIIFSTKHRQPLINDEIKPDLYAYIGGVVREHGGILYGIGGVSDHVHLLVNVSGAIGIVELVGKVKTASTRWMKNQGAMFEWQNGYGAFSVSVSNKEIVLRYIANQEAHHRKETFEAEYVKFLTKHGIEYDARYVFDE